MLARRDLLHGHRSAYPPPGKREESLGWRLSIPNPPFVNCARVSLPLFLKRWFPGWGRPAALGPSIVLLHRSPCGEQSHFYMSGGKVLPPCPRLDLSLIYFISRSFFHKDNCFLSRSIFPCLERCILFCLQRVLFPFLAFSPPGLNTLSL